MLVRIADDVPVVMLLRALANEGFELASTPYGLALRLSERYVEHGQCAGEFVPAFLRYRPGDGLPSPDALSFCPLV